MSIFREAIKSRNVNTNASIEIGANTARFAHLGNIAYRTKKKLEWDGKRFTNDEEANRYLIPSYRAPWVLPKV